MTQAAVLISDLVRRYRGRVALDRVSCEVPADAIVGLLGRNGSGKTTLMRIIAGQEFPTAGTVSVLGGVPAEHDGILGRIAFAREDQAFPDVDVASALRGAALLHPGWDARLARELLDEFRVARDHRIGRLSRGARSALAITIALAARAPVTMLDEPCAGLDPVARRSFYDRVISCYSAEPRTILFSTHLVDEAADLLERVIVLDRGRVAIDAATDDLRGAATTVSEPSASVDAFVDGRATWARRGSPSLGTAVIPGAVDGEQRDRARDLHLDLAPVSLQELIAHAGAPEREADR